METKIAFYGKVNRSASYKHTSINVINLNRWQLPQNIPKHAGNTKKIVIIFQFLKFLYNCCIGAKAAYPKPAKQLLYLHI